MEPQLLHSPKGFATSGALKLFVLLEVHGVMMPGQVASVREASLTTGAVMLFPTYTEKKQLLVL
jgi:hypothetical protein